MRTEVYLTKLYKEAHDVNSSPDRLAYLAENTIRQLFANNDKALQLYKNRILREAFKNNIGGGRIRITNTAPKKLVEVVVPGQEKKIGRPKGSKNKKVEDKKVAKKN